MNVVAIALILMGRAERMSHLYDTDNSNTAATHYGNAGVATPSPAKACSLYSMDLIRAFAS